jgi:hypothetical protein
MENVGWRIVLVLAIAMGSVFSLGCDGMTTQVDGDEEDLTVHVD